MWKFFINHHTRLSDSTEDGSDSDSDTSSALGVEIIGDLIMDAINIINKEEQTETEAEDDEEDSKTETEDGEEEEDGENKTIETFDDLLMKNTYTRLNEIVTTKVRSYLILSRYTILNFR